MRTSQLYQFDEFPTDNKFWWIRWVDNFTPHLGSSGTAGVTVFLSSIPDDTLESINKASDPYWIFRDYQRNAEINRIHLQVSNISALPIGTVFRNAIPQPSFRVSQSTINCDTTIFPQRLVNSKERDPRCPPNWDTNKYPHRLINPSQYLLEKEDPHWLCVLRSEETDFLIPCYEILRYFYCWNPIMARVFTTGPWKNNLHKVINPSRTGIDADNKNWYLTARKGFSLNHCNLLAPIFIDETGYRRANEIFLFLQNKNTNGTSSLRAKIPFRDGPIQLNVKGIWLQKDNSAKFLVFQILKHKWPYPEVVFNYNIDTDNRQGQIRIPIDAYPPFDSAGQQKLCLNTDIADIISSENDPNGNLSKINFTIPFPIVYNITETREKKETSCVYSKSHPYFDSTANGGENASTGEPSNSGSDHPANFVPIEPSDTDRFDELVEALNELKSAGSITGYAVLSPPDDRSKIYNELTLWNMPKLRGIVSGKLTYTSWALIKKGAVKRPRRALVVELKAISQNLYIIEVEIQSTDGYRALIFKPISPSVLHDAIDDALIYIVTNSGKIGKHPDIPGAIARARGWKHSYEYERNKSQPKVTIKKRKGLSNKSLMEAMMEVLG